MPTRTIAVGDIHGCSSGSGRSYPSSAGPSPLGPAVTLGDYLNRGPESRGAIDRPIDLGRRCRLAPLLGNHDQMPFKPVSGIHPNDLLGLEGIATLDSTTPDVTHPSSPNPHAGFLKEAARPHHETRKRTSSSTPATTPTCRWPSSPSNSCGGSRCGTGFPGPRLGQDGGRRAHAAARRRHPRIGPTQVRRHSGTPDLEASEIAARVPRFAISRFARTVRTSGSCRRR